MLALAVLGLTLLAFLLAAGLAVAGERSGERRGFFGLCLKITWAGFVIIYGLVGGKAA